MPRQYVRGGPWKNSEDEILKAAVMKYGLNQWSRVASLLNRKSAKQCKIRWYEWLDPNIKKTEWTREEEEKLLHLAKIMPTQWRTIAPIVGRTASQCLEHYERLLDEAQAREEGTSTTGEASSSSDDPRKPRVGEIDPNPETKPARPDPIHMDEDELEMLNEARARLANTKGKKQKRKAREKQLEQARRLAALQKRRELKAAGIQIAPPKQTKKKKPKNLASSVDYNKEIPFHIKPAPGFYDTTEEDLEAAKLSEVGNSMAIIEELQKHEEEERRKKEKEKISVLGDNNAPNKNVEKLIQANDNNSSKVFSNRKIKLVLPPPMITDEELETISKISKRFNNQNDLYKGSEVTKQLLGSSSNERTPFIQPTATPLKGDTTIERVRELQQVLNTPTPLQVSKMKDFEKNQEITKGSLSTFNSGLFGTPSTTVKTTPLVTPSPFRDQLHINGPTQDEVEVEFHKQRLREGFSKLPTPSGDKYAVLKKINPEDRTEYKDKSVDMEDAGEEESKRFEIENNERLQKQLLRSSAVKRQLPRPNDIIIDISALKETVNTKDINDNNEKLRIQIASEMIAREIQTMIASDAVNNPYKLLDEDGLLLDNNNSKKNYLEIPFNQWIRARVLLAQECSKYELPSFEEFNQIYDECLEKFTLEQVKEITKDAMKRLEEKTFEVSKQLEPVTSKYNLLLEHVKKVREEIYQAEIELDSYQKLEKLERNALPSRLTSLREEVEYVLQKEKDLQLQYKELIDEKEKLKIIHLPQEASDEMVIE